MMVMMVAVGRDDADAMLLVGIVVMAVSSHW